MSLETTVTHLDKTFKDVDYSEKDLRNREFVRCSFVNCNFTKSDLRTNDFEDCEFHNSNLTMANLDGVGLRDITFKGCKLLGIDFSSLNKFMFSFSFEDCQLDYSLFIGTNLKKINFVKCSLKQADFTNADLTLSVFAECDLMGSIFINTNLEKADFRTAINLQLDPDVNRMKKSRLTINQLPFLLSKYNLDIED